MPLELMLGSELRSVHPQEEMGPVPLNEASIYCSGLKRHAIFPGEEHNPTCIEILMTILEVRRCD
jgi:hypothetical protein